MEAGTSRVAHAVIRGKQEKGASANVADAVKSPPGEQVGIARSLSGCTKKDMTPTAPDPAPSHRYEEERSEAFSGCQRSICRA